jgi:arylsulfatase A-like enzyme
MSAREMNRRDFMKTAGAGMLAGTALARAGRSLAQTPPPPASPPNIVYILLDDAGYGDLGCYGQTLFETPSIDRLAGEGIRFTSHYSGSAVCAPSRCSLLTGQNTGHCAIRGNREVPEGEGQFPLPGNTVTLAHRLQKAGYATGAFGKWGLGGPGSTGHPLKMGFDTFYGYLCQRQAHDYYPGRLWHDDQIEILDESEYSHTAIMNRAVDFIKTKSAVDRPFFCYLPVTIPHASLHVPEEWAAPFRKKFKKFETLYGVYAGKPVTNPPAQFAGMMTLLDHNIGELMRILSDSGMDRNTVVMLASDNGPHREGGHLPDLFDSNGPFRGYKRDLYEGGIRVPFLARWLGRIAPGSSSSMACSFWDILPTLCHIAGAPPQAGEPGLDGVSLVPELLGASGRQEQHDYLYWELPESGGSQAVRRGAWKAVRQGGPDAPLELFNIEEDPGEQRDLSAAHPKKALELEDILRGARTESPEFPLYSTPVNN